MDFDDLQARHEVDQALAESIALGLMRDNGDGTLSLTSKGVVNVSMMFVQATIESADNRDFTKEERAGLIEHLQTALDALKKE